MTDKIPTIYASIGNREDVNTRPNARYAVASVLESYQAKDFHRLSPPDDDPHEYIAVLEQAVREALSPQFLADSLRQWGRATGTSFVDCSINALADDIAKKSL